MMTTTCTCWPRVLQAAGYMLIACIDAWKYLWTRYKSIQISITFPIEFECGDERSIKNLIKTTRINIQWSDDIQLKAAIITWISIVLWRKIRVEHTLPNGYGALSIYGIAWWACDGVAIRLSQSVCAIRTIDTFGLNQSHCIVAYHRIWYAQEKAQMNQYRNERLCKHFSALWIVEMIFALFLCLSYSRLNRYTGKHYTFQPRLKLLGVASRVIRWIFRQKINECSAIVLTASI